MTLPDQIRAARQALGLSQQALADALGSPSIQASIARWERGERTPDPATLGRLAVALGTVLSHEERIDGADVLVTARPAKVAA
jgi:transcriptional regulator with XRE-family HTH domain